MMLMFIQNIYLYKNEVIYYIKIRNNENWKFSNTA